MPETTYIQALGRRKSAIAQVRIYPGGSGKVTVNGREVKEYFKLETERNNALLPLQEVGRMDSVDVSVRAIGGGMRGQSDAVKLGIARALVKENDAFKTALKTKGYLSRDARIKERKKFGLRGARRSRQWRKR
ncbi:MAG: 30S ribosomal protein S9 [bacterium]|nr:30S ribosomal protein S9 [bacterium]MDA1024371.1 30S ribosomal protein S9 [bacterium]